MAAAATMVAALQAGTEVGVAVCFAGELPSSGLQHGKRWLLLERFGFTQAQQGRVKALLVGAAIAGDALERIARDRGGQERVAVLIHGVALARRQQG